MSKISLSGNPSGTATFTIESPATNTDRTLVLPDNAGTVLTSASDLAAANLTGNVAAARITDALNASGSAPIYACRAWVNFDGTGTPAIRGSGNVSSITDNGTGDYTVNFTTAMPDANYVAVQTASALGISGGISGIQKFSATTSALRTTVYRTDTGALIDRDGVDISIFR
jgi:hypothetical protein